MFTVCEIFALQRFDHSHKVRVENHVKAKCILDYNFRGPPLKNEIKVY